MKAPESAPAPNAPVGRSDTGARQQEVWRAVKQSQNLLSKNVGQTVAAPQSATSLQLAYENEKLQTARTAYIKTLQPAGEKDGDIVGYVFAINGKINSADVYPSNGLFRKMWSKSIAANATDGLLSKLDLKVLADDKHAFPPYQVSIAASQDRLRETPGMREALQELSGKFTNQTMQQLNYQVDGEHRPVSQVAAEFLKEMYGTTYGK